MAESAAAATYEAKSGSYHTCSMFDIQPDKNIRQKVRLVVHVLCSAGTLFDALIGPATTYRVRGVSTSLACSYFGLLALDPSYLGEGGPRDCRP